MPRLDFDYTPADLHTEERALDPESAVPGGVDGARYRFVDLDGEGIPGVLSQQGGALFYRRNDGGGRLAAARALPRKPNVAALGSVGQMLTSLDADGKMDLVLFGALRGRFKREPGLDAWRPFYPFVHAPNFDPADPNLRFLDVDGDGLADALLARDEVFVWCKSLGGDGFGRPHVVRKMGREDAGPTCVFADATESIFLADMTGDGMVDLVRVKNGEICYWPNLGYGRFGAKITMGNAPCFDRPDAFDPKRIRFGDVDGSGTSDIAYLRPDGAAIYLNQAGNRWSNAVLVPGVPTRPGVTIELCDLLGTGTACLVWSSAALRDERRPMRYVDLLASTKPHLLCRVTNNLGLETRVEYAPSTRFYLEDRAAGSPWVTRLPFPVQVIARVETADARAEDAARDDLPLQARLLRRRRAGAPGLRPRGPVGRGELRDRARRGPLAAGAERAGRRGPPAAGAHQELVRHGRVAREERPLRPLPRRMVRARSGAAAARSVARPWAALPGGRARGDAGAPRAR